MPNFRFKEYTPEEDKIYEESIYKIKQGLKNGLDFKESCSMINVDDPVLKRFIIDDALKIMIADMHYQNKLTLQQVADLLNVPLKTVNIANMEMLEEAGLASAEEYKKANPEDLFGNL